MIKQSFGDKYLKKRDHTCMCVIKIKRTRVKCASTKVY